MIGRGDIEGNFWITSTESASPGTSNALPEGARAEQTPPWSVHEGVEHAGRSAFALLENSDVVLSKGPWIALEVFSSWGVRGEKHQHTSAAGDCQANNGFVNRALVTVAVIGSTNRGQ